MNNKQMKKATVDAINVMIRHADKGPSGFWVEDHEGCGNPAKNEKVGGLFRPFRGLKKHSENSLCLFFIVLLSHLHKMGRCFFL